MPAPTPRPAGDPKILQASTQWCLAFLLTVLPASAAPPLRMAFDDNAIVVSDLEPGAEIVYFSISRASAGFAPRTESHEDRLVDEDGDGEVHVPLDHAVPRKFLAVAIELSSGRFDVLAPADSSRREIALPAGSLLEGPGHRLDQMEDHGAYIEFLLVRPGQGAWRLTTGDGASSDESIASDGVVRVSLSSMSSVGESGEPPEEYAKGDFLLRVAPREMEYYAVRINR